MSKFGTRAGDTRINSVAVGDVDGDSELEIITGGTFDDGSRTVAQLCVWDGASLALEDVQIWYWVDDTYLNSLAVGDVDADDQVEIVTVGYFSDGSDSHHIAQLCVWDGASLAFENVNTIGGNQFTSFTTVAIGDLDGDAQVEIVTGGYWYTGYHIALNAQLWVWNGATLGLEDDITWYMVI